MFVTGCGFSNKVVINGKVIDVEIADAPEERSKGLMFRESLKKNEGMLFVYEDSKIRSFWMKNTLIPLDIIFISEDFRIINIEVAVPCEEDPCRTYDSLKDVKYVLEVNKGYSMEKGIESGDFVEIKI